MATMITTRRAMPPSMSAREREVLVVGRSYAPALSGLVLCHAFLLDLELAILLCHPGHSRLSVPAPSVLACYAQRQFLCQTLLLRL